MQHSTLRLHCGDVANLDAVKLNEQQFPIVYGLSPTDSWKVYPNGEYEEQL